MKSKYVGVDISKDWLDVAVWDDTSKKPLPAKRVDNSAKSITALITSLRKKYKDESLWFCFEHTGNYGLLLSCILENMEVPYSAVPALEVKQSLGITRGKNDQVDAGRLAAYAATQSHKLKASKLAAHDLLRVKELLTYRAQLVRVQSQFKNSLKAHKVAHQVADVPFVINDLEQRISALGQDIKDIEKQIEDLITAKEDLAENYRYARSVKGVGLMIAAYMLVYTRNFTAFDNPRKFNCYIGTAPFEHSSGIKRGISKTSRLRHKYLKALLFNGANSAARYDPQLKRYYDRKCQEGKAHNLVMNAIACKLIYRVFATVRRKTPYVVLAN